MVLLVASAFTAIGLEASGQRISAAGSGQVAAVGGRLSTGVNAAGTGRESTGNSGFAISEGRPSVVSGKLAGYGARLGTASLGEHVWGGTSGSFSNTTFGSIGRDFPGNDFVATMPLPSAVAASTGSSLPGSGFGIALTGGALSAPRHAPTAAPHSTGTHRSIKDPDAILNPFTHTIGQGLGGKVGSAPTVLGGSH